MNFSYSVTPQNLRVICDPLPHHESVALALWICGGARKDPSGKAGLTHFVEHMMFKGTPRHTPKSLARAFEDVGARINAYTSRENTSFMVRCLPKDAEFVASLLHEMITASTFTRSSFESERAVILHEMADTQDDVDDVLYEGFIKTAFPKSSLSYPIIGTPQTFQTITHEDLLTFRTQMVQPASMIFVTSGKINQDFLEQSPFTSRLKQGSHAPQALEKPLYQGGVWHEEAPLEHLHGLWGCLGLPKGHPDIMALNLYSTLMGGGISGHLLQDLREKKGLTYHIQTFTSSFQDVGLFGVSFSVHPKDLEKICSEIIQAIENSHTRITEEDIMRVKHGMKAHMIMSMENLGKRCEFFAETAMISGAPKPLIHVLEALEKVTLKDVQRLIEYLLTSPSTLATLGPQI